MQSLSITLCHQNIAMTFSILNLSLTNLILQIEGYDWWGPTLANNQNHFAAVFSSFGHNSFPGLFNGLLRPSAEVQRILDAQRLMLSNYYVIGVQMRAILRLSKQAEEHVWRTMLFLKSRAEFFQTKQVVFYVCADSKDVWDRTVAIFGKDIIFSASITAGRVGRVTKEVQNPFMFRTCSAPLC